VLLDGLGEGEAGRVAVALVDVGLDGVEALGLALLGDHRLDDRHGGRRADVEVALGVAAHLGPEHPRRLELRVVAVAMPSSAAV